MFGSVASPGVVASAGDELGVTYGEGAPGILRDTPKKPPWMTSPALYRLTC